MALAQAKPRASTFNFLGLPRDLQYMVFDELVPEKLRLRMIQSWELPPWDRPDRHHSKIPAFKLLALCRKIRELMLEYLEYRNPIFSIRIQDAHYFPLPLIVRRLELQRVQVKNWDPTDCWDHFRLPSEAKLLASQFQFLDFDLVFESPRGQFESVSCVWADEIGRNGWRGFGSDKDLKWIEREFRKVLHNDDEELECSIHLHGPILRPREELSEDDEEDQELSEDEEEDQD
jgi:hypothetical protein